MTRALQQQIHVACRDLGLDQDARRDMQLAACGKASMRDMGAADLKLVIDHLKARGWAGPAKKSRGKKAAPRADLRFAHVLWGLLGQAEVLQDPSRAGLNRFIRAPFGGHWAVVPADIDMLRDPAQINDVITALKNWCRRVGISLRGKQG